MPFIMYFPAAFYSELMSVSTTAQAKFSSLFASFYNYVEYVYRTNVLTYYNALQKYNTHILYKID